MAQLAINVTVPLATAAQLANESRDVATAVALLVRDQFQDPNTAVVSVVTAAVNVLNPVVTEFLATGGVVGAITATGITTANTLIKVQQVVDAGQAVTDLTAEFSITSANTITNTTTNTTGSHLVVIWR